MSEQKPLYREFTKGIIKENPVLCLVLGTCPTLAVTTGVKSALGMGVAATMVLVCSNCVISLLRRVIPDKVRIPSYITVIAAFVTIVQLLVKAYAPSLHKALGVYLPLIVVNCIILGRAEMFASKHPVLPSLLDGLGMGVGFTAALVLMGSIREVLGAGSWFGLDIPFLSAHPILIFLMPPGGFFVFGMLMAASGRLSAAVSKRHSPESGCAACPMNEACARAHDKEACL